MTPFFGEIPYDSTDYAINHTEYINPYELIDVSEWDPDLDNQIEEYSNRMLEQMNMEDLEDGCMPAGPDDQENCDGGCCPTVGGESSEDYEEVRVEEEPPVPDEFAEDEDGWLWK